MRRKGRSEGTVANYTDHFEPLPKDGLDERLSKFGHEPGLLEQRHDQLTLDNGPYIANGAMRSFRAIYNHAAFRVRHLPHSYRQDEAGVAPTFLRLPEDLPDGRYAGLVHVEVRCVGGRKGAPST